MRPAGPHDTKNLSASRSLRSRTLPNEVLNLGSRPRRRRKRALNQEVTFKQSELPSLIDHELKKGDGNIMAQISPFKEPEVAVSKVGGRGRTEPVFKESATTSSARDDSKVSVRRHVEQKIEVAESTSGFDTKVNHGDNTEREVTSTGTITALFTDEEAAVSDGSNVERQRSASASSADEEPEVNEGNNRDGVGSCRNVQDGVEDGVREPKLLKLGRRVLYCAASWLANFKSSRQ